MLLLRTRLSSVKGHKLEHAHACEKEVHFSILSILIMDIIWGVSSFGYCFGYKLI